MHPLFPILGLLVAAYVVQSLFTGEIFAKSGVWGRRYRRDEHAWHYWSAVVCYSLLSLALLFIF